VGEGKINELDNEGSPIEATRVKRRYSYGSGGLLCGTRQEKNKAKKMGFFRGKKAELITEGMSCGGVL